MPVIRIICQNVSSLAESSVYEGAAAAENSTIVGTAADSVGAMKFTIAVVLVYGIGVIGLLGISARRSRSKAMMDKEIHNFIKSKLYHYTDRRQKKKKSNKTILKLISSLHSSSRHQESENNASLSNKQETVTVTVPPTKDLALTLNRSSSWSGKLLVHPDLDRRLSVIESVPLLQEASSQLFNAPKTPSQPHKTHKADDACKFSGDSSKIHVVIPKETKTSKCKHDKGAECKTEGNTCMCSAALM